MRAGDGMGEAGLSLTFEDVCCPPPVHQQPPAQHPYTPPVLPPLSSYLLSQFGKDDELEDG